MVSDYIEKDYKLHNIIDLPLQFNLEKEIKILSIKDKYTIIDIDNKIYKIRTTKKNPPKDCGSYLVKKIAYGKNKEYCRLEYSKKVTEVKTSNNSPNNPYKNILFIDVEPLNNSSDRKTREMGVIVNDLEFKSNSAKEITNFIKSIHLSYICGHNYRSFDKDFIENTSLHNILKDLKIIDTLELSYLFFPHTEVHKLPKNYFREDDFNFNPLEDSRLTRDLLSKLISKFIFFDDDHKNLYYSLLYDNENYKSFFEFFDLDFKEIDIFKTIEEIYSNKIENLDHLKILARDYKIELAFIIGIFNNDISLYSFSPIILERYPHIQELFNKLVFDAKKEIDKLEIYLKDSFNFEAFRPPFPKSNNQGSVSQRDIVSVALEDKNIFTILPTGGGKTLTFWLPAIIKAKKTRALTVVISPLQALMKDHIYNFNEKLLGQSSAAALSGYLTMPERREVQTKILNGTLDILYVAPESLRSQSLERMLTYRYIDRFVIDEAHCLSTWGNDFRHDYFYIAEFINKIVSKKKEKYKQSAIPISVFTATASIRTINEIKNYFKEELNVEFQDYIASSKRTNLKYKAFKVEKENQKKEKILEILKTIGNDSSLVYVPSSRKKCEDLANQLSEDLNKTFMAFHAGISSKNRSKILEDYISNKISGIVATTAFGMGIDKPDIRHVIHYEISSSLEDYLQESGRAGRDGKESYCYVVYEDKDFSKLFYSLIRQKVTFNEIKKIFQSIKYYKGRKKRNEDKVNLQISIKDLAEKIGINSDDEGSDYDTKIKTSILELERCGYLKRGYNKPNLYVTSINIKSIQEARNKMNNFNNEHVKSYEDLIIRICEILIKKSTRNSSLHIEDLANLVNIEFTDIDKLYKVLYLMRDLDIIGLKEDLLIGNFEKNKFINFIKLLNNTLIQLETQIFLFNKRDFQIRELNQVLKNKGVSLPHYETILPKLIMLFREKGKFEFYRYNIHLKRWHLNIIDIKDFKIKLRNYKSLLDCIKEYFIESYENRNEKDEAFFIQYHELVKESNQKLNTEFKINVYDKLILLLAKTKLFTLEGGRVVYNSKIEVSIDKKHLENRGLKYYTEEDYNLRMKPMYNTKRESFHIMNKYIEELLVHENKAKNFALDYFDLDYTDFIKKYNLKKRIKLPLPEVQYKFILNESTTQEQKEIIQDTTTNSMLILAGPGTGKTQVLINKIAHLIIEEDYKPEHFLMLTYTKSAALVFKNRLFKLIGDLAYDIDIFTFHGYAIELLGEYKGSSKNKNSDNNDLSNTISNIREKIKNDEITLGFKQVIVLDEFQDTGEDAYNFVKELYEKFAIMNENKSNIKIIAVGDDDQCIMESLSGADIEYMNRFKIDYPNKFKQYKLTTNFRSSKEIIDFSNEWISKLKSRVDFEKVMKPKSISNLINQEYSKVEVIKYKNPNFINQIYNYFLKDSESKEISIITLENQTVLDIYSSLKFDYDVNVRYLLKNDSFFLHYLDEIVFFTNELKKLIYKNEDINNIVSNDLFNKAKEKLFLEYKNSTNIEFIKKHIYEFEKEHSILTLSFWDSFIQETIIGDFKNYSSQVLVSTVHRAKGSEFEEVHIVLNKINNLRNIEYFLRLYYVAITRAKRNLFFHISENVLNQLNTHMNPQLNFFKNKDITSILEEDYYKQGKVLKLTSFDDIYLGFGFKTGYGYGTCLNAGEKVTIIKENNTFSFKHKNITIGMTSKKFTLEISDLLNKGYFISEVFIKYRTHYYLKDKDINVVYLYEIVFERTN